MKTFGKVTKEIYIVLEEAYLRYVTTKFQMDTGISNMVGQLSTCKKRTLSIAPRTFEVLDFVDCIGRLFNATLNIEHGVGRVRLRVCWMNVTA